MPSWQPRRRRRRTPRPRRRVALGGYLGAQISRTDTRTSEALGLFLAVIVLLYTLRRGWPVAIPLATAMVAVGMGLAIIGLLGRLVYIPEEAPTLGTMLGLGVGIDYALFLVMRHRNLLRRGFDVPDSVGRTAGTAGAGMVFAGATLLAAVSGLALTGISFLAWLGYSAAIVVVLALSAALTLVPALMGVMGLRVLPRSEQLTVAAGEVAEEQSDEDLDRGGWARMANVVTGHPWPFAIAATTLLLVLAAPMLSMQFQQVDSSALPDDTTAHQAGDIIRESFGPGYSGPLAIVAQLHRAAAVPENDDATTAGDPRALDPRLVAITEELAATDGIAEVSDPIVSTDGGVVIWRAVPSTGPSDKATEALVTRMRAEVLPSETAGADMTAYVGGVTAARTDLSLRIAERLLPFILGVATLSFLLLMVAYRSLVIPAKAAAMNLLSISAAYGVVVAVFQWGWGAQLIGLDGPVPIESYVPMMMFAILFGLSMDYEVFLLTAFNEHYQRTGDIVTAVRRGLADTGQLITAAALIMVAVFTSFVIPDNAVVKMFGVGLATAVLVDATIVRCILVPSLMVLAAKWTWWLPGWLDRALPQLHVEGDPAQLDSVGTVRAPEPSDQRPATGALALIAGALLAWVLGTAMVVAPATTPGFALALAAAGGAALAYLPRATRGAGGTLLVRLVLLLAGAALSAATFSLIGGVTPATRSNIAVQAAVAILVPALLTALTPLRRGAIPLLLGSVVAVSALSAGASSVPDVIVTAFMAAAVTRLLGALGRALGRGMDGGRSQGTPSPVGGAVEGEGAGTGHDPRRRRGRPGPGSAGATCRDAGRRYASRHAPGVGGAMIRTPLVLGAAGLVLLAVTGPATSASNLSDARQLADRATPTAATQSAEVVNDEVVMAELDPSGLPERAVLISRTTVQGPEREVIDPASGTNVRYLDRLGRPEVGPDGVVLLVGGKRPTVLTEARFDKPLPVAVHAEYAVAGAVVPAASIPGTSGEITVTYTLTNTTAEQTDLTYTDAAGQEQQATKPVFVPFQGTLTATLPEGAELVEAPDAMLATDEQGRTVARWNISLFPPVSTPIQSVALTMRDDRAGVPGAKVVLTPAGTDQDPATGFSADLLTGANEGNGQLYEGLDALDAAAGQLANGSDQLATGLAGLAGGANSAAGASESLAAGVNGLAKGAGKAADASESLASGVGRLADGADDVSDGSEKLAGALGQAATGAQDLADATAALARATSGSPADQVAPLISGGAQIEAGLLAAAGRIGGPSDPVLDITKPLPPDGNDVCPAGGTAPPDDDCATIYQGVRALRDGLKAVDDVVGEARGPRG